MSTLKRPLGLVAARAAKRQKKEANTPKPAVDERKVASTGDVLEDLQQMLKTALTTADPADEDLVELRGSADAANRVRLIEGRALIGLGLVLSEPGGERPREGEPTRMAEYIDAAITLLDECDGENATEPIWLHALCQLHLARIEESRDHYLGAVAALTSISPPDCPEPLDTVLLLISLCEDHLQAAPTEAALKWATDALRALPETADRDRALTDCLLSTASRTVEWVEEQAAEVEDGEWHLPEDPVVGTARDAAEEAAMLLRKLLETAADDDARRELTSKLGEALLTQATLTANEDAQEALYERAEKEAGVKVDDAA